MAAFRKATALGVLFALIWLSNLASSQEIQDIWQTTWNRASLFQYQKQTPPITFSNQGSSTRASIVVDDRQVYQPVLGVGGTLTDSSAQLLNGLKSVNPTRYWGLVRYLFSTSDADSAALSYLRVPLGATDFSDNVYSYDDFDGDLCLNDFTVSIAPDYLFEVLSDIRSVNSMLRVHLVPWSPPAWMKDSGTAFGGSLQAQYIPIYAHYLLKCLQAFQDKGITVYAISIQNEPMYESTTHPSARFTPQAEGQVGKTLRALMNSRGFKNTKLIGYEQDWDKAGDYPVKLMQNAGDAFDGVAFHCAAGSVGQQDAFHSAYPNKEIYLTECTGTHGTDWWGDIKWYMDNIFIGSIEHSAQAALMWNLALDSSGKPTLPGASTCGGKGCRGIVTINTNGTWSANQEFYAMAHLAKGTISRDIGGPDARRIRVEVQGTLGKALRVGAYVTPRANSAEWLRFSLVVLNWNDSASTKWNPQNVTSTVEFRGKRASLTFPVGITTLSWHAPNASKPETR